MIHESYYTQRLNSAGKSPYDPEEDEHDWENDDLGSDELHDTEFDFTAEED